MRSLCATVATLVFALCTARHNPPCAFPPLAAYVCAPCSHHTADNYATQQGAVRKKNTQRLCDR